MKYKLLLLLTFPFLFSCQGNHFLKENQYREQVESDFEQKKKLFADQSLFDIFNQPLTTQEKEALEFLYAYMPLGDVTDYSGEYYLENIRSSFRTRKETAWGKNVPDLFFRHFVLPIRINNENLDNSRTIFYEELKDRIAGLSMMDAVLEVNHWCHERVVYKPSDSRTSSPLASVKTAYGRCGEESTFTVAALRSIGIPARQVYTPRWAHTDDNHAWVEAWVDGKWYFLGACEPEAVLNKAWFNDAAARGMLMHTKVTGAYNGPEEVMNVTPNHTEINVIDNYAPTARVDVKIVDEAGQAVENALVEYKIYNYAEFYSVARKRTDKEGQSFLSAGLGDLLVWASKEGKFGYRKISMGKDKNVTISLEHQAGDPIEEALDIVPPVPGTIPCEVSPEAAARNQERLVEEDEIRNKYVATFCNAEKSAALAKELNLDPEAVGKVMIASRGNWKEIESFLKNTPSGLMDLAMELLNTISRKDLRDTPESVLRAHLEPVPEGMDHDIYVQYVMNPRIANELLTPYKQGLRKHVTEKEKAALVADPALLAQIIAEQIMSGDEFNSAHIPISPEGVWRGKIADSPSRDLFYVAVARSLGIPSRVDGVTGKVQYLDGRNWMDVNFENMETCLSDKGSVTASFTPDKIFPDPKYYSHFTIARITEEGTLQTLNFDEASDVSAGDSWSTLLKKPLRLDTGHYLLVTGARMASGKVLSEIRSFDIEKGKLSHTKLVMRQPKDEVQVIGNMDAEQKYLPITIEGIAGATTTGKGAEETSILSTTGRGYFIIGIIKNGQEPTNHALMDIAKYKKEFEKWSCKMLFLFPNEADAESFNADYFPALPETLSLGIDQEGKIAQMLANGTHLSSSTSLPIICIADSFGRIVFVSQGYSIGIGEQLMKTVSKL